MASRPHPHSQHVMVALFGVVGVSALLVVGFLLGHHGDAAGVTFIGRGVVKPGGSTDSINVYWTHVPSTADRIRGLRSDVLTGKAKLYKWEVSKGSLIKRRTTALATPEQEVVVRGTLLDDDRVTAAWVVQNYREFTVEGTLQGRTLDTGSIDEGYITVNVTSSVLRNVTPSRVFKQSLLKGKDLRIRVNGQTAVTALGKSKHLDEVTAGQQKVKVEGQLLNEDSWVASKVNEIN